MQSFSTPIFALSAPLLNGTSLPLHNFQGKVLLVVNTASRCGFSPQFGPLEELQKKFSARGFSVLGFPCNQFGGQEPGSAEEIGLFCQENYGVSFPIFEKIEVNGPRTHPIYRYLKSERSGLFGWFLGGRIGWNFTKFLVDRKGHVVARYAPSTDPSKIASAIERLLRQPA